MIAEGDISTAQCDKPYLDVPAGRWLAIDESGSMERKWQKVTYCTIEISSTRVM